jgi:hypothetical protein
MKFFLCAALMILLSGSALAAGWGQQTRIRGYYIYDSGAAYIKTDNNQNPDGCNNHLYLSFDTDAPNFKAIWAQIVSAYAMDQPVSLYYGGCMADYPKIKAIAIPNAW